MSKVTVAGKSKKETRAVILGKPYSHETATAEERKIYQHLMKLSKKK
jgi:hypothetical protein